MALIPPPFKNIIRYHGVFDPRHRWRSRAVRDRASVRAKLEAQRERELRKSVWDHLLATPPQFPETAIELPSPNWKWADLMRRSFGHELLTCKNFGGDRKVISTLSWEPVVSKFLACIRIEPGESDAMPARPPPEQMAWGW